MLNSKVQNQQQAVGLIDWENSEVLYSFKSKNQEVIWMKLIEYSAIQHYCDGKKWNTKQLVWPTIIVGCFINTPIFSKIFRFFTCTRGSHRIHLGQWLVLHFLLQVTWHLEIFSPVETFPRSKHTTEPENFRFKLYNYKKCRSRSRVSLWSMLCKPRKLQSNNCFHEISWPWVVTTKLKLNYVLILFILFHDTMMV